MEKEFVPYTEAFELKQLGFDEPCFGYYTEEYKTLIKNFCKYPINLPTKPFLAPTFSQAFRLFREKYNYDIVVSGSYNSGKKYFYRIETAPTIGLQSFGGDYRTYEQAELACLRKLIEIVKNK